MLSTDEVNAWCMPGGKVAVYTGLINKLQATDDELAAVLGHEIGSRAARAHARADVAAGDDADGDRPARARCSASATSARASPGAVANVTLQLPKSRGMENEADDIGVELAARAGYNPQAAVSLWQKMEKARRRQRAAEVALHAPAAARTASPTCRTRSRR